MVQFDHCLLGYAIFICPLLHSFGVGCTVSKRAGTPRRCCAYHRRRAASSGWRRDAAVACAAALAHQAMAMLVLTAATLHAATLAERVPRAIAAPARA
jgi:hypothetical protein